MIEVVVSWLFSSSYLTSLSGLHFRAIFWGSGFKNTENTHIHRTKKKTLHTHTRQKNKNNKHLNLIAMLKVQKKRYRAQKHSKLTLLENLHLRRKLRHLTAN